VESAHAVSLDGGCGFGGTLIAACFGNDGAILDRLEA
jgi:serine/threonine protein phosphatase 1